MSDEALIAELERQREPALRWFPSVEEPSGRPTLPLSERSEITAPIVAALKIHPVFGRGGNIFFAGKQLGLHPRQVPQVLLREMLRNDAASAVAWLHRAFKTDRAHLRMVAVVHGIEVRQPLSFGNGVCLLPLAVGPDSPNLRLYVWGHKNSSWTMDMPRARRPAVAVFDMGMVSASTDEMAGKAANDSAYNAILDITRGFTLTSNFSAPVVGSSWMDFVEQQLTDAEFTNMWTEASFEGSLRSFRPLKVDDNAIAWTERYLNMDEQSRRIVGVALDRLNLARRRRSAGDRAVDGGICLEALLGDDSPQELSYKLRLRAALLLGRTVDERQQIREDVRRFYDLRSKVVHGRVRTAKDASRDEKVASRGLEICTQAVRVIVQRNALPDFPTWELTGGPSVPEDG